MTPRKKVLRLIKGVVEEPGGEPVESEPTEAETRTRLFIRRERARKSRARRPAR